MLVLGLFSPCYISSGAAAKRRELTEQKNFSYAALSPLSIN